MVYLKNVTVAAGGSTESPERFRLYVSRGLVYRVLVGFPPGPSGLVGVKIADGGTVLWPSTGSEWLLGDRYTYDLNDLYWKVAEPWLFDIWAYNRDTAYDHAVTVGIGLVSREELMSRYLPGLGIQEIVGALRQAAEEAKPMSREQRIAEHEAWRASLEVPPIGEGKGPEGEQ